MFEFLLLFIAFAGTLIASYYDLRTTEIPDLLPIFMIISGILINFSNFLLTKNLENFFLSLLNGILFAAIGFSLYFSGQWGGGDAFLLTAIGFLIPKNFFIQSDLPFFFTFLTNLFFLGSLYMIIYSIIHALKNKSVMKDFKKQIEKFSLFLVILFFSFFGISLALSQILFKIIDIKTSFLTSIITLVLILIWMFSKSVEKSFVKRIPISQLKVGDVLLESKRWDGITEKEIKEIKKSGKKYVYVKSGVCFAPAFFIALIFTFLYGNSVIFFFRLLSLI